MLAIGELIFVKVTQYKVVERFLAVVSLFTAFCEPDGRCFLAAWAISNSIFLYKLSCFENEKHQTRFSLLLELVSDAYLTADQTEDL